MKMQNKIYEEVKKFKAIAGFGVSAETNEGDKYLKKISSDFDLGILEDILESKEDEKELNKKIKDIKNEI